MDIFFSESFCITYEYEDKKRTFRFRIHENGSLLTSVLDNTAKT